MQENLAIEDDEILDDEEAYAGSEENKILLHAVTEKPEITDLLNSVCSIDSKFAFKFFKHEDDLDNLVQDINFLVFECRLMEGLDDIQCAKDDLENRV
jgi:hypothetical protein